MEYPVSRRTGISHRDTKSLNLFVSQGSVSVVCNRTVLEQTVPSLSLARFPNLAILVLCHSSQKQGPEKTDPIAGEVSQPRHSCLIPLKKTGTGKTDPIAGGVS